MDLPAELFPEDKVDPTVKPRDMSVEETLGVIGHVRATTRARKWRYLKTDLPNAEALAKIREVYNDLPFDAPIDRQGDQWAMWSGVDKDGRPTEPSEPAFEVHEPYVVPTSAFSTAPAPPPSSNTPTITLPMAPEQIKSHVATLRELGIKGRVRLPDGTELEL